MPTPTNPTQPSRTINTYDAESAKQVAELVRQNTHLAALLDGVLADDPQAIRDAAAWLTVNRPADTGGDTVGEGER